MWTAKGEKVTELPTTGVDVGTLHVFDKELYAGDEGGNVCTYLPIYLRNMNVSILFLKRLLAYLVNV